MSTFWKARGAIRFEQAPSFDAMCNFVDEGMQIACVPFACGRDVCLAIIDQTRAAFRAKNHPIGIMLEVEDACAAQGASFAAGQRVDFLLTSAKQAATLAVAQTDGPALCAKVQCLQDLCLVQHLPIRGVLLTHCSPDMLPSLRSLRSEGKFLFVAEESTYADDADGFLCSPARFAAMRSASPLAEMHAGPAAFDQAPLQQEVSALLKDRPEVLLVLTCDGVNVREIASLYPSIPLIAIARRPEYERLLLSLIAHCQVVPTAITKIPDAPQRLTFAAYVAGLYGFTSGKALVCGQCWETALNQDPCIIDLALVP